MLSGEDEDNGVLTHEFFIHTSGNTHVGEVDNAFKYNKDAESSSLELIETNRDEDQEIDENAAYEEIYIKQEFVFVNESIEYKHETDQNKKSEVGETDQQDIGDAETETSDIEEPPFRKTDELEENSSAAVAASISICFICFGNIESNAKNESSNAQHIQINSLCNDNDIGVDSVLKLAPFVARDLNDLTSTASSVNSNELFEIFCRYLNVSSADSPSEFMEYSLNFPLCKSCAASLINLLIYHNQMEKLNQLTKQITSTLTAKIVESYQREKTKYRTQLAPCSCALRQQIYKRYDVKVSLHDVKVDSESNYNSDIFESGNYEESNISNSEMTSGIPEVEIDCSSPPSLVQCSSRTSVHNKITNTSCVSSCPDQARVTRFSVKAAVSSNLPNSSNDDSNNDASNSGKVNQMQRMKNPRIRRRNNKGSKQNNRMVEVSTNMFLYANKYFIKKGKSKFKCCLCGLKRESKYKLFEHIRKDHIKNNPLLNSKKKIQFTPSQLTQKPLVPSAHIEKVNEQSEISNNNCDRFLNTPLPQLEPKNEEHTCTMKSLIPSSDKIISDSSTTISNIAAENTDSEDSDYQPMGKGNRKYVEVEPDKFLYAKKYIYVKLGQGFKCHTCGFICNGRRGINTHIRNTHLKARKTTRVNNKWEEVSPGKYVYAHQYPVEEMEGRFKCCTCEYTTKGKYKMFEHLRTKHLRPVEESYMCDSCGKTYNRVDSLRSHKKLSCAMISKSAEGSDEKCVCNVCKKGFKNEEYLRQHRRVHSGDDKKNFVCEFCGAKFWGSSRLKDHMAQHTGDKLFECQFCPSRFTTYNIMHYHRIREHGRVGDLTGFH